MPTFDVLTTIAQISVEDSYLRAKLPTVSLALDKIRSLSTSLLNRLELELVDEPLSLLPTTAPRTWARHPTQIRLTLRGGPGAGSKTVPMPLDTLDLAVDKGERAEKLSMAFGSLFKKMIGPTLAASKERVSIHVCVYFTYLARVCCEQLAQHQPRCSRLSS